MGRARSGIGQWIWGIARYSIMKGSWLTGLAPHAWRNVNRKGVEMELLIRHLRVPPRGLALSSSVSLAAFDWFTRFPSKFYVSVVKLSPYT